MNVSSTGNVTVISCSLIFAGELTKPSTKDTTKSSTSGDSKEEEEVKKLLEDESGKMIDQERSETGRVRSLAARFILW